MYFLFPSNHCDPAVLMKLGLYHDSAVIPKNYDAATGSRLLEMLRTWIMCAGDTDKISSLLPNTVVSVFVIATLTLTSGPTSTGPCPTPDVLDHSTAVVLCTFVSCNRSLQQRSRDC